jgi:phosphoribosylformimino-5-aminoimidazole carboxamide ribotide isomerase
VRVIGVIDLRGGLAVHARGGVRGSYQPVDAVGTTSSARGDALGLARAYASLDISELYVADLDAITTSAAGVNDHVVSAIAGVGLPVWLDAGVSSVAGACHALGLGATRAVVGLETLASYDELGRICAAVGRDRVAFSLDLKGGAPLRTPEDLSTYEGGSRRAPEDAASVAARAASTGVSSMIVLDLARVGNCSGLDASLLARIRHAVPDVELVAGGGVRGANDLELLTRLGYDGALVATAMLSGALTADDIAVVQRA